MSPSIPYLGAAIIELGSHDFSGKIAGLNLLDRLVICFHRAGFERIILVAPAMPLLPRAAAMNIKVEHLTKFPEGCEQAVVAAANVLAIPDDIRRIRESRGRLVTQQGEKLPLGAVNWPSANWRAELNQAPDIIANGPAACLVDAESAHRMERIYWASLTSSSDGWVDRRFNRPVGRILSRVLVHTEITPNQVSMASIVIGLISASLFAAGTPPTGVAGALCLQLSAIVDCVDGDLARALFKQSSLGKWLDIVGDQAVHIAVFLGLAIGLARSGSTAPVLMLGMAAAVGVILSFTVILQTLLRPSLRGQNRVQKLIDATTNRDFSVLLILFALFGALDWFLWMAAIGSHVFWILALTLQIFERRKLQRHDAIH